MKLAFEVTNAHDHQTRTIIAAFPDFIAFEEKYKKSVASFDEGVTLTQLSFLAWHAEHRMKKTGLDFESWTNDVEMLILADPNEAVIVPLENSQHIG